MSKYYKVIGENHGNFPYKLGLNSLADNDEKFDNGKRCGPGGLYFCTLKHVYGNLLESGDKICEITIPPDAQVVFVNKNESIKADKIYIESISFIDADLLVKIGACKGKWRDHILCVAARKGRIDIVKDLIKLKANIHAYGDGALYLSAKHDRLEIAKILVEAGANIRAKHHRALIIAHLNGHTEMFSYLRNELEKNPRRLRKCQEAKSYFAAVWNVGKAFAEDVFPPKLKDLFK